jgi:hypothetical protein
LIGPLIYGSTGACTAPVLSAALREDRGGSGEIRSAAGPGRRAGAGLNARIRPRQVLAPLRIAMWTG